MRARQMICNYCAADVLLAGLRPLLARGTRAKPEYLCHCFRMLCLHSALQMHVCDGSANLIKIVQWALHRSFLSTVWPCRALYHVRIHHSHSSPEGE